MATKTSAPSQADKIWAVLGYAWVLALPVLLLRRDKFVHDHAKQGLLLFIGEILMFIPVIGWILGVLSWVLAVVGMINAWRGESWKVPYIGEKWDKAVQL